MIPLFLILDPKHDAAVTTAAQKALGGTVLHVREIGDLSALLSVCKGVVSMRLHALILAASVGCVGVGILPDSRDGKIPAFANSVGMEFLPPENLCVGNLVEAIERMLTSAPRLTPILLDSVAELRKKATKDLANIVEMIYNNSQ
jgi:polysaccharide pyruvyl transferase WcaK-like protein